MSIIKRLLRTLRRIKDEPAVEPVIFDHVARRRAQARAYLRSRKIHHAKGLYGSPYGVPGGEGKARG